MWQMTSTIAECKGLCSMRIECLAFDYTESSNLCRIYGEIPTHVAGDPETWCWQKVSNENPIVIEGCALSWQQYTSQKQTSGHAFYFQCPENCEISKICGVSHICDTLYL